MASTQTAAVDADPKHTRWVQEITRYESQFQKWTKRGKSIVKRYKDERSENGRDAKASRYNILWSNVETLKPALYARNPKPDIERRFRDKDPVGRVASQVLERSTAYFVDCDAFGNTMRAVVQDKLLPGRGTLWVRYVPHMRDIELSGQEVAEDGSQITDDTAPGDAEYGEGEAPQEVYFEETLADYVHWEDFGHCDGRTWQEVDGAWRRVYLSRKQLVERFGKEKGEQVPLDATAKITGSEKPDTSAIRKACIYEIWDKGAKEAIWLHKDVFQLLDKRPDPLGLKDFYPFPRPVYATLGNDSLVPVPDYVQYQDQAAELDDLTGRITSLTKALKVAGVYDAAAPALARLLSEGTENTLIPVEQWAVFGDKGGLKGAVDFMPMTDIIQTLLGLYDAREKVKQTIYEITGIADIIRGQSNPTETATAQQIKGRFATLRLSDGQTEIQRFARDVVEIMAQIVAGHFSIDTLKQISGVKIMTAAEKQQAEMQMQIAQQQAEATGQQPPPLPEDIEEMLKQPTWEEVDALLKDSAALSFRIDIETDSTIKMDEDAEKQSRIELLGAAGSFIQQMIEVPPALQPLAGKMLLFGLRGFKIGKDIEASFDQAIAQMEEQAKTPQPNAEMMKAQADQQKQQSDAQLQQQKLQMQAQMDQQKQQMEAARAEANAQQQIAIEQIKAQAKADVDRYKADLDAQVAREKAATDAQVKLAGAQINAEASIRTAAMSPPVTGA